MAGARASLLPSSCSQPIYRCTRNDCWCGASEVSPFVVSVHVCDTCKCKFELLAIRSEDQEAYNKAFSPILSTDLDVQVAARTALTNFNY
eukprot:5803787-Pleurochrysis_carterae.AAC.1